MSFGGFLDGGGGGGAGARFVADLPYTINSTTNNNPTGGIGGGGNISSGAIAPPRLITQSLTKSMFNSPGLSLALTNMDGGQGDLAARLPEGFEHNDELDRVCALAGKFLGRPILSLANSIAPPLPSSSLELGVGSNGFGSLTMATSMPIGPDFGGGLSGNLAVVQPPVRPTPGTGLDRSVERSMLLELALAAMDELVKMAQTDEPLWIGSLEGGREILNQEEYMRTFTPCIGMKSNGFVTEASRETGMVIINSLALVETLMDSNRWAEMFPCLIARTTTIDVISSGMGGSRNGALQLMHAELQVLSPLVPVREVSFLRFCKQHAEGVWAVVDVSVDAMRETPTGGGSPFINCRRLPSGCVVQDMPNGYSKEMAHIAKGQDHGNCVSLLRASAMNANQSSMLILQETCIDAAGSLVVYAPVDIPAMHVVMNGGDSAYVALLPSGFAIVADGAVTGGRSPSGGEGGRQGERGTGGGSLLTVAFQILVNSLPTAKLTVESVETVNNLISCTVQKIKAALQCET
ncbi:Homeobox-leucine zipper protein ANTHOCYANINLESS 2, partial [Cucurbita argyrosperma subsp. sororia]